MWTAVELLPKEANAPSDELLDHLLEENLLLETSPPSLEVTAITAALSPIASLQGTLPLGPDATTPTVLTQIINATSSSLPPVIPPASVIPMSLSATTGGVAPGTGSAPSSHGLRGVPPEFFDGRRAKSDKFLIEFHRFRQLNRNNDLMSNPYNRVLAALSYMRGPLIEDWSNAQNKALDAKINHITNPVPDTSETLWTQFEVAFKAAWDDTQGKTTAYDQLMKLEMKNLDIDTYTATFERLATAAGWEPNAQGTIARYRGGLTEAVHRRILFRENLPVTMDEWKEAARKEVGRLREISNAGLGPKRNFPRPNHPFTGQYQSTSQKTSSRTNGVVPMDVDATSPPPLKKLTEEDRKKLSAEGRCFRCRKQGHMSRTCPGNPGPPPAPTIRGTDNRSSSPTPSGSSLSTVSSVSSIASTSTEKPLKPSKAQQIAAIEASMTDEERGAYLDARYMGDEDFLNAEL